MQNKKQNKNNGTVVTAVALVAASALLIGAAALIKKGNKTDTEESKTEISRVSEQSKGEVIEKVSTPEESREESLPEETSKTGEVS